MVRPASQPEGLKTWAFAPETTCIPEDEYVDVEVIDLSEFKHPQLDGTYSADLGTDEKARQAQLVERTFKAFKQMGFLALKGHGLTKTEFQRQFDLGRFLIEDVSEEEKHRLHARIWEGNWAGYKPRGYYKRPDGSADQIDYCDFYPHTARTSSMPDIGKAYVKEVRGFIQYNHYHIVRKLLAIMSLGLGLAPDELWKLHQAQGIIEDDGALDVGPDDEINWKHSKDHLRYAKYHPISEEDRIRKKNLLLPGHTDLGSVTLLYSQPIAGLQIMTGDGHWRYVRYYPEHILVNLGDCMEFMTGGMFKATPHRVREPPKDQRHLDRLGIFYFVPFQPDTPLRPIQALSHCAGHKDVFEEYYRLGGHPMTCKDWIVAKSKLIGTRRVQRGKRVAQDILEDIHFRYNP